MVLALNMGALLYTSELKKWNHNLQPVCFHTSFLMACHTSPLRNMQRYPSSVPSRCLTGAYG